MIEVRQHPEFAKWFAALRDRQARNRIAIRIVRLEAGLLGDAKFFGTIGELRIDAGPGYRVYFTRRENAIVILLLGGDKSTQEKDIRRARALAEDL